MRGLSSNRINFHEKVQNQPPPRLCGPVPGNRCRPSLVTIDQASAVTNGEQASHDLLVEDVSEHKQSRPDCRFVSDAKMELSWTRMSLCDLGSTMCEHHHWSSGSLHMQTRYMSCSPDGIAMCQPSGLENRDASEGGPRQSSPSLASTWQWKCSRCTPPGRKGGPYSDSGRRGRRLRGTTRGRRNVWWRSRPATRPLTGRVDRAPRKDDVRQVASQCVPQLLPRSYWPWHLHIAILSRLDPFSRSAEQNVIIPMGCGLENVLPQAHRLCHFGRNPGAPVVADFPPCVAPSVHNRAVLLLLCWALLRKTAFGPKSRFPVPVQATSSISALTRRHRGI